MLNVRLKSFYEGQIEEPKMTSVQERTYRLLQGCFCGCREVKVQDLMEELGIEKVKTFFSRLDHLQQKGLIEYSR